MEHLINHGARLEKLFKEIWDMYGWHERTKT
jgi:uncharacterized protein (DUF2132 family)